MEIRENTAMNSNTNYLIPSLTPYDVLTTNSLSENECLNYWLTQNNKPEGLSVVTDISTEDDYFRLVIQNENNPSVPLKITSPIAAKTLVKSILAADLFKVNSIRLNNVEFSPDALTAFAKELSFLPYLDCLEFENMDFVEHQLMDFLSNVDPHKQKLDSLEFHFLKFNTYLKNDLEKFLDKNSKLINLDFHHVDNTQTDFRDFFFFLIDHQLIARIDLNECSLNAEEINALASLIVLSQNFGELNLRANNLNQEVLAPLIEALNTRKELNYEKIFTLNTPLAIGLKASVSETNTPDFCDFHNPIMGSLEQIFDGSLGNDPLYYDNFWTENLNYYINKIERSQFQLVIQPSNALHINSQVAIQQLIKAIESQKILLKEIVLENFSISPDCVKELSKLITMQPQLETLTFVSVNNFFDLNELDPEKKIHMVSFTGCDFDKKMVNSLSKYCSNHANLQAFELSEIKRCEDITIHTILDSLSTCKLKTLLIHGLELNLSEIKLISNLIEFQLSLKSLDLIKVGLNPENFHLIIASLKKQYENLKSNNLLEQSTISLNVSHNQINDTMIYDFLDSTTTVNQLILLNTDVKSMVTPLKIAIDNRLLHVELDKLAFPTKDELEAIKVLCGTKLSYHPDKIKTIEFTVDPSIAPLPFFTLYKKVIEMHGYICEAYVSENHLEMQTHFSDSNSVKNSSIDNFNFSAIYQKILQSELTKDLFQEILSVKNPTLRKELFLMFLEKQGLITYSQSPNGNCFFEGLIKSLMNGKSTPEQEARLGKNLRRKIVEELRANPDDYSPYINWECHPSFESHCNSISKDMVWAGPSEVAAAPQVLSKWLRVNAYLNVYAFDGFKPGFKEVIENGLIKTRDQYIYGPKKPDPSKPNRIFYLFNTGDPAHYQAMILSEDKSKRGIKRDREEESEAPTTHESKKTFGKITFP